MTDIAVQDTPAVTSTARLAAQGDEAAFARLFSEYRAPMARVAFVICGDPEATRDAVQAAWSIAGVACEPCATPIRLVRG